MSKCNFVLVMLCILAIVALSMSFINELKELRDVTIKARIVQIEDGEIVRKLSLTGLKLIGSEGDYVLIYNEVKSNRQELDNQEGLPKTSQ